MILHQDAHDHLVALGYEHIHHEADWYDDGDGESGPHLAGGPAYDVYRDADTEVFISDKGRVECGPRDLEREAYEAAMDAYYEGLPA